MQLVGYFDRGAALWPDRLCLVDGDHRRTYRDVEAATHAIAHALLKNGSRIECPAAVLSLNHAIAFEAVLGILRAGATWLPVNARGTEDEISSFLKRHGCEILFFHSDYAQLVANLRSYVPSLRTFVCLDRTLGRTPSLASWCSGFSGRVEPLEVKSEHVAVIKNTGGTTGLPKSVMQTHGNFEALAASFLASMHFTEPPVHLVAAPMTHGAGSICFPLMACGATNVILPVADPNLILQAIESYRVNVLFLPPTVIYMMLAQPDLHRHDYSSLKYFIYAAAPMSVDKLKMAMAVFGPVMTQMYGQAEAPMICTFLGPDEHRFDSEKAAKRLLSCGRPTPFTAVEIMDDRGKLLGPGERGEIVAKGNLIFKGYYQNAEATREVSVNGWHHTGDIGYRDEDGYVYIVDRKKDMIISGGFNIYPSEVEQVLWTHPAVQDCAVIGVPDEKWGEAVKAVIELKSGQSADPAELIDLCKRRLGSVKAPKSVEIWPQLPRSAVGKVLKKDIRERYWRERDRAI